MKRSSIWLVIPAYNEASRLASLLRTIMTIHPQVVLVDDGSSDLTAAVARKIIPHVVVHPLNLGKGAAMKTGAEYALATLSAQAVVFMDADGQHSPDDIPQFVTALKAGHHLVFGVRDFTVMPVIRRLSNLSSSALIKVFFGEYIPDIPSGFKALTYQAYHKVEWLASDYAVELEIAVNTARFHLDYITVPIQTKYYPTLRGMTAVDAVKSGAKIISWRLGL